MYNHISELVRLSYDLASTDLLDFSRLGNFVGQKVCISHLSFLWQMLSFVRNAWFLGDDWCCCLILLFREYSDPLSK